MGCRLDVPREASRPHLNGHDARECGHGLHLSDVDKDGTTALSESNAGAIFAIEILHSLNPDLLLEHALDLASLELVMDHGGDIERLGKFDGRSGSLVPEIVHSLIPHFRIGRLEGFHSHRIFILLRHFRILLNSHNTIP